MLAFPNSMQEDKGTTGSSGLKKNLFWGWKKNDSESLIAGMFHFIFKNSYIMVSIRKKIKKSWFVNKNKKDNNIETIFRNAKEYNLWECCSGLGCEPGCDAACSGRLAGRLNTISN